VTENGVATFNSMFHDWSKPVWFATFNIPDMILPSDAEYLTLALHLETLKDSDIFST